MYQCRVNITSSSGTTRNVVALADSGCEGSEFIINSEVAKNMQLQLVTVVDAQNVDGSALKLQVYEDVMISVCFANV